MSGGAIVGVLVLIMLIGPIMRGAVQGVRWIAGAVANNRAAVRSF